MNTKHRTDRLDRRKRALLKVTVGAGIVGGMPETWVKPVIQTIILPLHASTTNQIIDLAIPLVARLNGVVDGAIGTEFVVDAGASTGPEGFIFAFSSQGACSLVSQSGSTAVIRRNLIAGTCEVSVVVSAGSEVDDATASAEVSGGPPTPP